MGIEHSQNYLHSKQLVATLLSKSNICNDDIIIEIGPGKGIITIELAKKSKQVIAIEFDAKLAKTLSEKYKESKKVQIIEMDFLKYKISVKEPYKVCANIPFNITADIVKKVFEADNPPEDIYFIMQYEAFLRYSGQPFYNESLRSLLYKPWFSAELIYEFKPSDFYPVPNARICLGLVEIVLCISLLFLNISAQSTVFAGVAVGIIFLFFGFYKTETGIKNKFLDDKF